MNPWRARKSICGALAKAASGSVAVVIRGGGVFRKAAPANHLPIAQSLATASMYANIRPKSASWGEGCHEVTHSVSDRVDACLWRDSRCATKTRAIKGVADHFR